MKLLAFRVRRFRSINDSGVVALGKRTALVGRNESGKSNLLKALHSVNPAEGLHALTMTRDYPLDKVLGDPSETCVWTRWRLSRQEREEARARWPRVSLRDVTVSRRYEAVRDVTFHDVRFTEERDAQDAAAWVLGLLPVFVYQEEFPDLTGRVDVKALAASKGGSEESRHLRKLCRAADLDEELLERLPGEEADRRRRQLNVASNALTRRLRRLWTDNEVKVRFDLDGDRFSIMVLDSAAEDGVEVNLNERSRGFQWYFSFFVNFAADTLHGGRNDAILLLDEPGLFLHAASQTDLLRLLSDTLPNQVVFTTHSPFMVPLDDLESVRTVTRRSGQGTMVHNDRSGDATTLFPLQSAFGYRMARELLAGDHNLIIENLTDYWFLQAASEHLLAAGRVGLDHRWLVSPGGGDARTSYMLFLFAPATSSAFILTSEEPLGKSAKDRMVQQGLVREDAVILASEGRSDGRPANLEDLIDEQVYAGLVRRAYRKELEDTQLILNTSTARIVERYGTAFRRAGLSFSRDRVAKLFVRQAAVEPATVLTPTALDRFERLFRAINNRLPDEDEA